METVIVLGDTEDEILKSIAIAKQLREFGLVIVRDTKFNQFYYDKFMNDAEVYFDKFLRLPGNDEFHKQRGFTPQLPFFRGDSDPLLRYFWSVGSATYEELCLNNLVPTGMSDWKQTVNDCGSKMLDTIEAVAKLADIGLGLPSKAISSKMTLGPHQLVSTGIDLGAVNEGTVLEPPHVDMNLLTIQGRNRYLGLHIWSKQGQKVEVNIPIDHFLILAGKQLEYLTGGEVVAPKHEVAILQNTMNELIQNKEAKDRRISLWRVSATVFAHVGVGTTLKPLGAYGSLESYNKYLPKSGGQYMKESFPEVFPTRPLTSDEIEEVLQYMKKNE